MLKLDAFKRIFSLFFILFLLFLSPSIAHSDVTFYLYNLPARSILSNIDTFGNVLNQYKYDAFGNVLNASLSSRLYAGEQFEAESKLIYLRNRYYSPQLGRFISKDPFSGYTQNPQTKNGYPYCNNNPISFADPLGLDYTNYNVSFTPIGTAVGALTSALLSGGSLTYVGAGLGSLGVTAGLMRDNVTGALSPSLGPSLGQSIGPSISERITH